MKKHKKEWEKDMEVQVFQNQYSDIFEQTGKTRHLIREGWIEYIHPLFLIIRDENKGLHYISLSKNEVNQKVLK